MFIVDRTSHLGGRFRLAQVATLRILIGLIGESVCQFCQLHSDFLGRGADRSTMIEMFLGSLSLAWHFPEPKTRRIHGGRKP